MLDDSERIGVVNALGLDETLFVRRGEWHRQHWATSIVDVRRVVLLDMIEGRDAKPSIKWLGEQPKPWRDAIE